ncbi:hypothetical protein ACFWPX_33270 [Nocardia sp. NPDC058518]|uniref:hypothetical protein n=1 Tax=Nocardia sp. NPDC058518 TaxID=3346534 RepID=UPI00365CB92E
MFEIAWPTDFDAFEGTTEEMIDRLSRVGWVLDDVTFGVSSTPPTPIGRVPFEVQVVEMTFHHDGAARRLRITGADFAQFTPPGKRADVRVLWSVAPTSNPVGGDMIRHVRHFQVIVPETEVVAMVDASIAATYEPGQDLMSFLGDPSAMVSVFALAGAFISGAISKAGEETFSAMKRAVTRAPRSIRVDSEGTRDWVVLHDVEYNSVIECPAELPAEAVAQLARRSPDELTRVHLRWDSQARSWVVVGVVEGTPPPTSDEGDDGAAA